MSLEWVGHGLVIAIAIGMLVYVVHLAGGWRQFWRQWFEDMF